MEGCFVSFSFMPWLDQLLRILFRNPTLDGRVFVGVYFSAENIQILLFKFRSWQVSTLTASLENKNRCYLPLALSNWLIGRESNVKNWLYRMRKSKTSETILDVCMYVCMYSLYVGNSVQVASRVAEHF